MKWRLDHLREETRVLRAIGRGHNTIAALRDQVGMADASIARICSRLRGRGLVKRIDDQTDRRSPAVWAPTMGGNLVINAQTNPAPLAPAQPRKARVEAVRPRPIDDAARNGRAQLLSDGETYAMGRWTNDGWVSAPGAAPLDITPVEVLL